jgi:hypothetical protein
MEQKAQLVTMAAVLCQQDAYIFSEELSSRINEICGGPQLDQFKTKQEAFESIMKAFQGLHTAKQRRLLRQALGNKSFRAKRCLKETIKNIFKRLCLRITVEDLERWATWLEKLVDNFFKPTGVKWVEPIGLVGESAVGKTTSYPLAIFLVLNGFFPTPGKFSNEKLQRFIVSLSLDGKLPLDEWFGDCENIAPEANCDYAYVSIFFAALLLFFVFGFS